MVGIFIYVDGIAYGIELFKDETISITSSVQNFNEIGKLFTDYSQSFTIPASATNNQIFKYWYENALDNGFDHKIKYYGYIEIDTLNFRYGKFQLEKANRKDGYIDSYTIGFVGNLTQLKDRFKADKLNSLGYFDGADRISYYDELNFDYTASNLYGLLTDFNPNVAFPLIGNNRRYEAGTGSGSDITTSSGKVNMRELFPAIQVYKIFEYIQSAYGLTFIGVAWNALFLKNLWLYCKNAEKFTSYPESLKVNFTSKDSGFNSEIRGYLNLDTDELIFKFNDLTTFSNANVRLESWLKIFPTDNSIEYTVEIYDNGIIYYTSPVITGVADLGYFSKTRDQEPKVNGEYPLHKFSYKISSTIPMTFNAQVQYKRNYGLPYFFEDKFGYAGPQTTGGFLTIQKYIPDITVESFLVGIVKAFNLMIIPVDETTFEFVTMDVYYERGRIVDITDMCDSQVEEIIKPKLFKSIKFQYETSENILNNAFRGLFNRDYGDLIFDNNNLTSTETWEVKLPFENIMFENYTDTNFITATCWDKDQNAYTPKPVLLYDNYLEDLSIDGTITDINYDFGGIVYQNPKFRKFTNQLNIGASDPLYSFSLNFGDEFSVESSDDAPPKGLFTTYYANYVQNLYSLKTRKVNIKAILSTYWASNLQLNDRIILKNKRYTINTMTINPQTRETTFELLSDFRQLPTPATPLRNSNIQLIALDNTEQELQLQIYLNDSDYWQAKTATGFLTGAYFKDKTYLDDILDVTVPENTTGVDRDGSVVIEYYKDEIGKSIQIPIFQNA
jgi:hypothetical protein